MAPTQRLRRAIRVRGTVQGIGFRPAMFHLATELDLAGFVRNEHDGVRIEIEGAPESLARFVESIARAAPPQARIESMETTELPAQGERHFSIVPSEHSQSAPRAAGIPADAAPCPQCLHELQDPADRRYRYPFINCTACGPRFTIVRALPYDRAQTTMVDFKLCAACRREYEDPADRRFHAESNACPTCGPRVTLVAPGRASLSSDAALHAAARLLSSGALLALKGAGGYLLAADASDEKAVALLRVRKGRPHKPFAVMARDLAHVERVAQLDPAARAALCSPARPIVLLPARAGAGLAPSVAPGLSSLGLFLPPTPLQHLLAAEGPPLMVMTSGNIAGGPIVCDDDVALDALAPLVDAVLMHDRVIHARADDSVLRIIAGAPTPVRRARGYVPDVLRLPVSCALPVLAVGAAFKNTICLAHDGRALLSQHIGDLDHPDARASFHQAIAHIERLAGVIPRVLAHDLHPDYAPTRFAHESGLARIAVQHHHAHVAACLAEHGRTGPAIGVAFDGTGHGTDGGLWGGEILQANLGGFRRLGHLRALALPGGEAAIMEPWRLALAALLDAGETPGHFFSHIDPARIARIAGLLQRAAPMPYATSAGRWFDAVAALCGVRDEITYEGQAPMELESIAGELEAPSYEFAIDRQEEAPFVVDLRPTIRQIAAERRRGEPASWIAARFHETLARIVLACCEQARAGGSPSLVALSGGCFLNRRLAERATALLESAGFEVLLHRHVPPNDGGLSFGQAAVASFRLATES